MANSGIVDLDADFVDLGRRNFDVLNTQVFASLPCHGCLASNRLVSHWSAPVFYRVKIIFFFVLDSTLPCWHVEYVNAESSTPTRLWSEKGVYDLA